MSPFEIGITITAIVFGVIFLVLVHELLKVEPPKYTPIESHPRLSPPTDSTVYTFKLDSELKAEEWELLFNAGWEFVTSNTETYTDYAGCYPEAPKYTKTCWHYVFKKKPSADSD